jgi:outer membrane protein OmpA-like peptidoglycan-associated protein
MTPLSVSRITVFAAAAFLAAAFAAPALASELSTLDIVKALKPKPKVRAFSQEQAARETRQSEVVNRLQREKTRAITVEEKEEIAAVIETNNLPAIDLDVFFGPTSAKIAPKALPVLEKLAGALNDQSLKNSVFLVAGRADAEEARELALSEDRANAVRDVLIDKFGVAPERLVAVGFSGDQLKEKGKPLGGENRRVQVVNIASQQAGKN